MPFVLIKWLAKIFVDFNSFNKDEMNIVLEQTIIVQNKRQKDKVKDKLTDIALITLTIILENIR